MKTRIYEDFFKDKTVTLLGLGLLGRGVGDAAFLAQYCKKVFVTDNKSAEELKPSLEALSQYKNIEFVLGGHKEENFIDVDFVIKGAGVRLDNSFVALAKAHTIPVYMSTALFAYLSGIEIIGVTGTRGKTTVTYMIAEILKQAGKNILLGGNIRGVSTLSFLPQASDYDLAVLELDSWQLQGFDDLKISPHIGVFTTFFPDHMNYYDGDMGRYLKDKSAIFRHQKPEDTLVTTRDVSDLLTAELQSLSSKVVITTPLPSHFSLKVPGAHNLMNAAMAKAVAKLCGISESMIDSALENFSGVEGRLQYVGKWNERTFYNDSNSTTQEATLAALNAFPSQSIVLIFGGADKGLPIEGMIDYITKHKIRSVLIKGTGSDRVLQTLPHLQIAQSMHEAVTMAIKLSKTDDNVILSPAFASFGVFKNEYDRSDQFLSELKNVMIGKS
jgi:UDP-N-acetylmuramoylalanine--D-glutamate ligase